MIRINLLPHREMRRERRKKEFLISLGLVAGGAVVAGVLVGSYINHLISGQEDRNRLIATENKKLDEDIKEIARLKEEIEGLRARQVAVENLQADRTLPVRLFDELVANVPEGIYLTRLKQEETKVTLFGVAQSNERVSELLRNLAYHSPWLVKPELMEIKLAVVKAPKGETGKRRIYEFSLNALLMRREDDEAMDRDEPVRRVNRKTAAAAQAGRVN
ncbi:MAG: PilN domain-containing protein [Burkholderiales bacterium]|nr:MAG: PilN domain-containing protein [Burkholderiales bacterium]